jgi:hypothetical protein
MLWGYCPDQKGEIRMDRHVNGYLLRRWYGMSIGCLYPGREFPRSAGELEEYVRKKTARNG